ncbi:ABC transporter permease [Hymenobacter sp. 5516J-16]|uniref:ABC transporter permease n=1 Tax=Hymenobacter sp. 5516J-16 TaxID=2932253 RepID=UPI001FD11C8D|nr:ABC transporter permease [Hymenobacter sp. 5516J-16]UOQ78351.1 ABC transporter permease [Hymenobacter sp. 5516J-16]
MATVFGVGFGLFFLPELLTSPVPGVTLWLAASGLVYLLLRHTAWARRPITFPLDALLMGGINLLDSIPILILVIGVAAVQRPSAAGIIALLTLTCWTTPARIMRAATLQVAARPYVEAARMLGLTNAQLLRRHIWPNTWPLLVVQLPLTVAALIGLETTLSFLGVGFSPDIPSWGKLLSTVRQAPTAWWLALWPGLALAATIVSLHSLARLGETRSDVTK